jgi:hypothetical protein
MGSSLKKGGDQLKTGICQFGEQIHALAQTVTRKTKKALAVTFRNLKWSIRTALKFLHKQWRTILTTTLIFTLNTLQFLQTKIQNVVESKHLLDGETSKEPVPSPPNLRSPTPSSSAPTKSTTATTSTTSTLSSSPTWLSSSSSSKSNTPSISAGVGTTTTTTTKKKKHKKHPTSLSTKGKKNQVVTFPRESRSDKGDVETAVVGTSFLGSMFSRLLSGLLVLGGGALVGYYLSSDWREERMRHQDTEFVAVIIDDETAATMTATPNIVPITPETRNGRY